MIFTKIEIKPHLAEYLFAQYGKCNPEPHVSFPDKEYLYHVVHNLMMKRPCNVSPIDCGNLNIALPHRSRGKDPLIYNYISKNGVRIIERKANRLFFAHLHDFVDEQVNTYGQQINDSVYLFMAKFEIFSITSDALVKSYYRYTADLRRKIKKRNYRKKNQ